MLAAPAKQPASAISRISSSRYNTLPRCRGSSTVVKKSRTVPEALSMTPSAKEGSYESQSLPGRNPKSATVQAIALFFQYGITAVYLLIGVLIAVNLFTRGGRETLNLSIESLAEGARNALSVGVACALVGVIIGTMTLTGLGSNFVRVIVSVGEG